METPTDYVLRISHCVPEALLNELKFYAKKEGLSVQKLFAQFIQIYNEYLDASFVKDKSYRMKKQATFTLQLREDIGNKFNKRAEREKVTYQDVLTQFTINYLNFKKEIESKK